MDAVSKLFVLMMVIALLVGWAVMRVAPEFNRTSILESNDQNLYYSSVR